MTSLHPQQARTPAYPATPLAGPPYYSSYDRGTTVLAGIVIDALDVARMQEFWAEATQGRTHGLYLRFEATTKPKAGKNRLHLDLAGGEGWNAEVERLIALGAARADIGQGEVDWDVLTDPEGNEFCVLRPGHPGVRPGSGIAAICLDVAPHDRFRQSGAPPIRCPGE